MSFGGFSDIQRDRDRAHSSRHRNSATRGEEPEEHSSYGEAEDRGFSAYARGEETPGRGGGGGGGAGTYRRGEEEGGQQEEEGRGGGRIPHREQQQRRNADNRRTDDYADRGDSEYSTTEGTYGRGGTESRGNSERSNYAGGRGGYGGSNSYEGNNSTNHDSSTNGGGGGGGGINWGAVAGSVAEAGITHFAKSYDKSAEANKEGSGANGSGSGNSGGQPSAFGQRLANREEAESGGSMVKQAYVGGAYWNSLPFWCSADLRM